MHLPLKSSFFKDLGLTSNRLVTSEKNGERLMIFIGSNYFIKAKN